LEGQLVAMSLHEGSCMPGFCKSPRCKINRFFNVKNKPCLCQGRTIYLNRARVFVTIYETWQETPNSVMGMAVVKTYQAIPEGALCPEHADKIGA
jgi:hypothetical protein